MQMRLGEREKRRPRTGRVWRNVREVNYFFVFVISYLSRK